MAHGNSFDEDSVKAPGGKWLVLALVLAVLGIALAAGGWFMGGEKALAHNMHSYLTSYMFYLSIALGGLFFTLLQHLVRAGWSVTVRRMAEGYMKNLILMLLLFTPIFFNIDSIFAWADDGQSTVKTEQKADGNHGEAKTEDLQKAGGGHESHYGRIDKIKDERLSHHLHKVLEHKQVYLSEGFFKIRMGIYFLIWIGLALFMFRNSVAQDSHGEAKTTILMGKVSAGAMPLFALTTTFASFDWMMSLDYAWFSTIFGVIYFSSGFIGILATLIVTSFVLQKRGYLKGAVTVEHYHDMGKFMFAFIIFWSYCSFSQFILIRYPNIPEETVWFLHRWELFGGDGWKFWTIALVLVHFALPFVLLMSRHVKRNKVTCTLMACWMLVASWFQFYWIIMPTLEFPRQTLPQFSTSDILIAVGLGLVFIGGFLFNLRNVNLIPVRDPRLKEAVNFTNY
jgi:hypothetical protein